MLDYDIYKIANIVFKKESEPIDKKYFDFVELYPKYKSLVLNLRESFEIYKPDGVNDDKMVDAVGHFEACSHYIIEITKKNYDRAKRQIRRTGEHLLKKGHNIVKVAVVFDQNRWGSLSKYYQIDSNGLIKNRKKNNNERIYISYRDKQIIKNVYAFKVDFKKYSLE